jgi:hypothetical protein
LRVVASPKFLKAKRKAVQPLQLKLDEAVRTIAADPTIGTRKKGDLADVLVYTLKDGPRQYLVAYMVEDEQLLLLAWGVHESFYRDLKK